MPGDDIFDRKVDNAYLLAENARLRIEIEQLTRQMNEEEAKRAAAAYDRQLKECLKKYGITKINPPK